MLAPGKGRGGPCCIHAGRSAPRGGFPGSEPDQRARKEAYIIVFERPAILSRGWGSGEWGENALLPILSDPPRGEI